MPRPCQKGPNNPMYGRTHTEEARRKISESQMGEHHWTFNRGHSDETKAKISKSLTGNIASDKTKQKMSDQRREKNHHNWKGYYEIDGVQFSTAKLAAKAVGHRSHATVYNRVKNPNFPNYRFIPSK